MTLPTVPIGQVPPSSELPRGTGPVSPGLCEIWRMPIVIKLGARVAHGLDGRSLSFLICGK